MKAHYNGSDLGPTATIGQRDGDRPVCGTTSTRTTQQWEDVTCTKCQAYRPRALQVGQAVRHRNGRIGIITDAPVHGGESWRVMFLGGAFVVLASTEDLTPVTLAEVGH